MKNKEINQASCQRKEKRKTLVITLAVLLLIGLLICLVKRGDREEQPLAPDAGTEQLIYRIQNCSRLYTTEYQVHKIVTHEDQKALQVGGMKVEIPFTDRHIAIPMDATLKAYIDLGLFSAKNIRIQGDQVLITLPDPHVEVTSTIIDHDNTLRSVSILRNDYTAREQEALHQQGLQSIKENILSSGILESARLSAARTIIPMVVHMGYKEENIHITYSQDTFTPADVSRLTDTSFSPVSSSKE